MVLTRINGWYECDMLVGKTCGVWFGARLSSWSCNYKSMMKLTGKLIQQSVQYKTSEGTGNLTFEVNIGNDCNV
jgi:hypothetical protein